MKLSRIAVATALLTVAAGTQAANDGTLGTTSQGDTTVTIVKQNVVLLSDMDDIAFTVPGVVTTDLVASDDVCVFSSSGDYNVTVATDGQLEDGANSIAFTVDWLVGGASVATDGTETTTGNSAVTDCGGGSNASIEVTVTAADYNGAPIGSYSDIVTVTVAAI